MPSLLSSVVVQIGISIVHLLRKIESNDGVDDQVSALRSVANSTPQVAMHVGYLVPILNPAEVPLIEAVPIASRSFVNIAICAAAGITATSFAQLE